MANQKPLLVIEVSGGVVQDVYTDADLAVVLVDWDNINAGDEGGPYPVHKLAALPDDTANQIPDEYLPDSLMG